MSIRREPVRLEFDATSFTGRMGLAVEAGRQMSRRLALEQATWEPHDWTEWT